jgi:hypothetical protein
LVEDQLLDPAVLGGAPGHIITGAQNSLQAGFEFNIFVGGFLAEMKAAPKQMTTPDELDEDLSALLNKLLHQYIQIYQGDELITRGVDIADEETVLRAALETYLSINEIKENWELIIKKWVELLAWRHLERLAPPEGGAAERMDFQF